MRTPGKTLRLSAGVAATTIAALLLLYGSFQRSATAHASPAPELLSALPAGAPTLVYVDLAAVRASSFYQHRADKTPIAVPNQDYADFIRSTGFDFEKDLDRVAIASWPATGKEQKIDVAIAEGRFDRAKISDFARRTGKLDHQQARDVFLFSTGKPMGFVSVTFLDNHRIALVGGPSIAPLFTGRGNDPGADPVRERAARVDGAAAFMITRVQPMPDNPGAGSATQAAQFVNMARSVQWITLAARPEGDDLRISLEGECDNSTNAQQLKSALEVLRMLGRAGLDSPKTRQSMDPAALATLQTLLANAEVTQAAERVRILFELTPDIFKVGEKHSSQ
jgi:hypothetical protein